MPEIKMATIDLSYALEDGMFKYPSDPEIEIRRVKAKIKRTENSEKRHKAGWIEARIRNHHGTHIDAPAHKIPGGKTIDQYPIEKFINLANLVVLKYTDLFARPEKEITLGDVKNQFDLHYFKDLGALIFYTGFCDEMSRNEGLLKGQAKAEFEAGFPYFSEGAIRHILEKCPNLNILGVDSFSVDRQGSNSEVHRTLFERNILLLETLANLKDIDQELHTFQLVCHPIKIKGGDAAPTRAYVTF